MYITKSTHEIIETIDGDEYIRFDAENWYKWFGNSLELVTDPSKLEEKYDKTITPTIIGEIMEEIGEEINEL